MTHWFTEFKHLISELRKDIRLMSQATDALTAAVSALTASVDTLIAANAAPKENTAVIQAQTDAVVALTGKVNEALTPPAAPAAAPAATPIVA